MDPQEIMSRYKCVMVMYVMEQIVERSWLGDFKTHLSKDEKEKLKTNCEAVYKRGNSLVERVVENS